MGSNKELRKYGLTKRQQLLDPTLKQTIGCLRCFVIEESSPTLALSTANPDMRDPRSLYLGNFEPSELGQKKKNLVSVTQEQPTRVCRGEKCMEIVQ